jgi:hypothetical protein
VIDVRCDEPDESFEEEESDNVCHVYQHAREMEGKPWVTFWHGFCLMLWGFALVCAALMGLFALEYGDRLIDLMKAVLSGR